MNRYTQRPVRFLEVFQQDDWQIKIYLMSTKDTSVDEQTNIQQSLLYIPTKASLHVFGKWQYCGMNETCGLSMF